MGVERGLQAPQKQIESALERVVGQVDVISVGDPGQVRELVGWQLADLFGQVDR